MNKKRLMLMMLAVKGFFIVAACMMMVHKRSLDAQTEPADAPVWTHEAATVSDIVKANENKPTDPGLYNAEGRTGLMAAVARGDYDKVKMFLCQSENSLSDCKVTNVNTKSVFNQLAPEELGDTALHYACLFADNGDIQDEQGNSGGLRIVEALLKAGADATAKNALGNTPLHLVLDITDLCKRLKIVKLLLAHGANLNAQNATGNTMAHLAVGRNDRSWLLLLMKAYGDKFNLKIKNNLGMTPAQMAGPEYYGFGDLATDLTTDPSILSAIPYPVQKCLDEQ